MDTQPNESKNMSLLSPPPFRPETTGPEADARYRHLRVQVFAGAFIGYAAFYLVRKNFAMAIPMLEQLGIGKSELGIALGMNAVAYALSKFLMGSVSDRSDARKFLPLGLVLSAIAMASMAVPVTWLDILHHPERGNVAVGMMAALNFLVGWFGGMGWPPCGRVMTHWFSQNERGTVMAVWNCAHNVGGGLIGPMASYGAVWFGSWLYGAHTELYFLAGTFIFPAATVIPIAILAYILLRDTPQSQGLPAVEKWRGDFSRHYDERSEAVLSTRDIMLRHVLPNKCLWAIALSNAFIYMVRYGCLDWAPALLSDQGVDIKSAGWAYFAYEYAAIPGTLICGIISDRVFRGNRAWPTMLFMAVVALFITIYWYSSSLDTPSISLVTLSLTGIGFFIYGPVMLVGVQALDLVPKNAAGTAAGLTGFFGYFLGTAILANTAIGYISSHAGWNWTFVCLLLACLLSILLMLPTLERKRPQPHAGNPFKQQKNTDEE